MFFYELSWLTTTVIALSFIAITLALFAWYANSQKDKHKTESKKEQKEFKQFQTQFLIVYVIIMFADWLQGTHMYTLYQSYGVDISTLFLTGFCSSAIFGTIVGSLSDRFGRKRACILYCIIEIGTNLLEHYPNFYLLLIGRLFGGVSTSLLFSVFESWMVSEHHKRGFSENSLQHTFSLSSALNGASAIFAGFVAQTAVEIVGHDIAPFQIAIALTTIAMFIIIFYWKENYGSDEIKNKNTNNSTTTTTTTTTKNKNSENKNNQKKENTSHENNVFKLIYENSLVLLIGLVCSLFEGGMYTFVFMWVPVMQNIIIRIRKEESFRAGVIFSCFMIAVTIGGIIIDLVFTFTKAKSSFLMTIVLSISAISMFICFLFTESLLVIFISFLLIEICVGMFQPISGVLRSEYYSDSKKSTLISISRVFLNILVVGGTKLTDCLNHSTVFAVCSFAFFIALLLQIKFILIEKKINLPNKSH